MQSYTTSGNQQVGLGVSISYTDNNYYVFIGIPGGYNYPDGSVMIFHLDNSEWKNISTINGSGNETLGAQISMYGNYAIVRAYTYNNNEGAVYFYEYSNLNWSSNTSISLGGSEGGVEGITVSMYEMMLWLCAQHMIILKVVLSFMN